MEVGTFADMDKIPSGKYSQTEQGNVLRQTHNWQTVLGMVVRSGDIEVPSLIPITNEGIMLKDKLYKS